VPDVSIRDAVAADAPALGEIYRRASLSNEGDRAILLAHPEALVFSLRAGEEGVRVAVVNARIVGFATVLVTGQVAELEDLFVDPDWLLHGVGRALVADAVPRARGRGATRIEVTANAHARDFYAKAGFVLAGVTRTRFGVARRMHLDVPS
jgi:GNAT superfamily N-acetyltransferase